MYVIKNKIVVVVLSLFVFFSSINYSFAENNEPLNFDIQNINPLVLPGVVLAPEMILTIGTVLVASGVVLPNLDDIYDISRLFYEQNKNEWDKVEQVFKASVAIGSNKVVNVGNSFLELCKSTFDKYFLSSNDNIVDVDGYTSVTDLTSSGIYNYTHVFYDFKSMYDTLSTPIDMGMLTVDAMSFDGDKFLLSARIKDSYLTYRGPVLKSHFDKNSFYRICYLSSGSVLSAHFGSGSGPWTYIVPADGIYLLRSDAKGIYSPYRIFDFDTDITPAVSLPYVPGSYDWDNVKDNQKENGSLDVYVPGNGASLPGVVGGGTIAKPGINPPYELPNDGSVILPGIDNPSIGVGDNITIPGVTVPGELCPECGSTVGTHNPGCSLDKPINPPIDGIFPPWGSGIDFSPITNGGFTEKFPFSIPTDIKNIISVFDVKPKAPIFEVPMVSEKVVIDLTYFNVWALIIRFFILLSFVVCLINITRKVIG